MPPEPVLMSAAARDKTADETGGRRDNLRAVAAVFRVGWRLRRTDRTTGAEQNEDGGDQ